MLVAQISDLHVSTPDSPIERLCRTEAHLQKAVLHLQTLRPRPDVVLATGDLADHGRIPEYERLRAILEPLEMPVYVIPGNHDDRSNLVQVFGDRGYLPRDGGFLQYAVEDWPLRLIGLDTLVPGSNGGLLCSERLAWLDARLCEAPERPTLIFMHHPPFLTGMPAMDAMGLDGSSALAAVVRRHSQVEGIVCGHVHRPIVRRFGGTVASTCPSTAHQVALDLAPETRLAVVMEPPACVLHVWLDEAEGLTSHVSQIEARPMMTVFDGTRWLARPRPPEGFDRT